MKKLTWLLLSITLRFLPVSAQDAWTRKADFFEARQGAASFTINNKLYVATGNEKADLWEYDPATNVWTQKADLPASGRSYATGFSIGNKGYIATGVKVETFGSFGLDSLMSDVWEYDPAANSWTRKADFGGGRRARAVAFDLNGKAYVGSGESSPGPIPWARDYPNRVAEDFWLFDPVADTWNRIADIPLRRMNAIAFSAQGKGFVGTGFYNTYTKYNFLKVYPGDNLQDLWAYDTASNTWSQKTSFPSGKRMGMSVFTIGDTAYAVAGAEVVGNKYWTSDADVLKKDVWAYNIVADTWLQKADFPDTGRRYAYAAAIAGKGYIGAGGAKELWGYTPAAAMIPLPLTLVSFSGHITNSIAQLQWTVKNEQALNRYEIEKSTNGIDFAKVGEVKASNQAQYRYEGNLSPVTKTGYYRLKMVDDDGSISYSKVITLLNNKEANLVMNFYPSPLTGNNGFLLISSTTNQQLQVVVTNLVGHQLSKQTVAVVGGYNNIPFTFEKLTAGTYFIRVMDEKKAFNTIRFVKL